MIIVGLLKRDWDTHTDCSKQIIPSSSNGHDAANFRTLKESNSLHLDDQVVTAPGLPSGHRTRPGRTGSRRQTDGTDLFGAFSSVTLHYDGDS
jgi:protein-serine/threonine kinase